MSENSAEQNLLAFLFGVAIVAVFGGFLLPLTLKTGSEARTMLRWPATQGRVESARLKHYSGKGGSGYLPELEYSYSVGDQRYHGSRTSADGYGSARPHWSEEDVALRSLPVIGQPIPVRYDPAHPNQSVIYVTDPGGADYFAAGFLSLLAVLAAVVAFVAGRRLYLAPIREMKEGNQSKR